MEIVVFLMAERIKAPHRKAGIFQRQRQRWQVRLGTKKGNSFLMEGKWGHPISLQSLLLLLPGRSQIRLQDHLERDQGGRCRAQRILLLRLEWWSVPCSCFSGQVKIFLKALRK